MQVIELSLPQDPNHRNYRHNFAVTIPMESRPLLRRKAAFIRNSIIGISSVSSMASGSQSDQGERFSPSHSVPSIVVRPTEHCYALSLQTLHLQTLTHAFIRPCD